jgi:hypothetical protein
MVGEKSTYSNKVNFSEKGNIITQIKPISFSAANFREIISVSKSAKGKAYLFKDGLLKLNLVEDSIETEYFMVAFNE